MSTALFHLALNVGDLAIARAFYGELLGCREGRSTATWVDFDFFGHQLSLHLGPVLHTENSGQVDDVRVPMPHFGIILDYPDWQALSERLTQAGTEFVIPLTRRFAGQPGEQYTMFFRDPFGNPIECKGFRDRAEIYNH